MVPHGPWAKKLGRGMMLAGVVVACSFALLWLAACLGWADFFKSRQPSHARAASANVFHGTLLLAGGVFGWGWLILVWQKPEKLPPWAAKPHAEDAGQQIVRRLKISGIVVASLVPALLFFACAGLLRFPTAWSAERRQETVLQMLIALVLAAGGLFALAWQWRREGKLAPKTQGLPAWHEAKQDEHLPYR